MENHLTQQEPALQSEETITPQIAEIQNENVGFWVFFGLIALFAIPVVGFIACIVFMFAPKKKSMKNFARAVFAWMVIRIASAILAVSLALNFAANLLLPAINDQLQTQFQSADELFGLTKSLISRDYSAIIESLYPQLIESIGEEYAPLLKELSKEKYNEMFEKVVKRDYATLLKDFKGGKYSDLADTIGKEEFNDLIDQLEDASAGKPTELFDAVNEYLSYLPIK